MPRLASLLSLVIVGAICAAGVWPKAGTGAPVDRIYGKIQFVDSFPDYKVKVVQSFPDLKVQKVATFANSPGEWQIVDSFPDFKIQIVDSFPDFTVQYVNSFPGPVSDADGKPAAE